MRREDIKAMRSLRKAALDAIDELDRHLGSTPRVDGEETVRVKNNRKKLAAARAQVSSVS